MVRSTGIHVLLRKGSYTLSCKKNPIEKVDVTMKPFEKKILTGAIAASFLLGGAGLLNQAQAEDATGTGVTDSKAATKITAQGERGFGFGGHEKRQGFRGGSIIQETAALLGVEPSEITEALKAGKTLLQIAQEKGLSEADYLQKLTDAKNKAIAEAVSSGKLTQEQADKITSGLAERLQKEIERTGMGKGGAPNKGGFPGGSRGGNAVKETAALLGVEPSVITDGLKAGKTLSQIAQEKGLSEADYLQKLTDAENKAIAEAVAAGKLTQEQAHKMISGLAERLQKEITNTMPQGFRGKEGFGGKHGMGGWGNPESLAKAAGVTAEELKTGMEAGKSLSDIAQEKGISQDQLIGNIKDGLTDQIKQFVEMKREPRN
ncbi:MAG: hypothetical protein K0S39_2547 [Paenibacillus sp.]|jgi:predicted transcriptional regulator|nr:hypothetical protein [Paenibacillus sp.]